MIPRLPLDRCVLSSPADPAARGPYAWVAARKREERRNFSSGFAKPAFSSACAKARCAYLRTYIIPSATSTACCRFCRFVFARLRAQRKNAKNRSDGGRRGRQFFGGMLARAGLDVTLIARGEHLEALIRDGLFLDSKHFRELIRVRATDDPRWRDAEIILFA